MTQPKSSSFLFRTILALLLMIGFYGLALLIAGALIFLPYAELKYAHRLHFKIVAVCLAGAGVIIWSILPRRDRFTPPGPRLESSKQRFMFREIYNISKALKQRMPAEVYLTAEVNAWVSHRGGMMGLGSKPVMGLGLPLLQILTIPQLRAVLAHEFGHYYSGDVKLGPWIYKTRAAIGRTIENLVKKGSILQKPFLWYGQMFLRVTTGISREQEYAADRLAAGTVGSKPLISGLSSLSAAAFGFEAYWRNEIVPVLNAGYCPPIAAGFAHFMNAAKVADAVSRALEDKKNNPEPDGYNTHPSLPARINAIKNLPSPKEMGNEPLAVTLLNDLPYLETQILESIGGEKETQSLKAVDWEEVGSQVYLPKWAGLASEYSEGLAGVNASSIPEKLEDLKNFGRRLNERKGEVLSPEEENRFAISVMGAAFAVALFRQGWKLHHAPGAGVSLERGGDNIEPFGVVASFVSGELGADVWLERCQAMGISEIPVGESSRETEKLLG